MSFLKKDTFSELAQVHGQHCVSMFIPTHRAGNDEGQRQDRINFKNQIKEAKRKLSVYGLTPEEAENYLSPAEDLLKEDLFFSRQSDGLAIFLSKQGIQYFTCPLRFEPLTMVSDHFYLRPIIPLVNDEGRFFLLSLSLSSAKLYVATQHAISEIATPEGIPQGMEEVVGEDYVERALQFRSKHTTAGEGTMYHGHGAGNDTEKKIEALQYFQKVNDKILLEIREEKIPLVVACVEYLFPLYKEANNYKFLFDKPVEGNPEFEDIIKLKEKAWDLLQPVFTDQKNREIEKYNEYLGSGKASYDFQQIIPAAISGQTEALFIRDGAFLWGYYDPEKHRVETEENDGVDKVDLLNLAATKTILNDGKVYIVSEEDMPDKTSIANAVFRYGVQ